MRNPTIHLVHPLVTVDPDCPVSATYKTPTGILDESICIRIGADSHSMTLDLPPEVAVRLYGLIGSELKVREEHLDYQRRKAEAERGEEVGEEKR